MDIETIIKNHKSIRKQNFKSDLKNDLKNTENTSIDSKDSIKYLHSKIPDIFFDEILVKFKLNRVDILVLMSLYRSVWCRPNLAKKYGISPMFSIKQLIEDFEINISQYHHSIKYLEDLGFLSTIRSGQYFVRRYFTKEFDDLFGQSYDE